MTMPEADPSVPGQPGQVADAIDRVADLVDNLVPVSENVANEVLVDDSRAIHWAGALFAGCAVALVPWTAYLAVTLPSAHQAAHYAAAWAGYDVGLLISIAATAISAWRRSPALGVVAGWTAAMLAVDAWFDVLTSPTTSELIQAGLAAAFIELPLAVVCVWLSYHTQEIAERRLRLLLRRRRPAERESPSLPSA
jgi:hypothetical protein